MPPSSTRRESKRPPATSPGVNEVTLVGRLSGPETRTLPSGDSLVSFRVIVDRPPRDRGPSGRVSVDALDCVAASARLQARVLAMPEGEVVEVKGTLRRRFWRSPGGAASKVEVQASALRRY